MKERKRRRTRKEKALRRLVLAAVLAAACLTVGGVKPLPTQAITVTEELYDVGPTQVVKDLGPIPIEGSGVNRLYLSANEGGILISLPRLSLLRGWRAYGGNSLDCSQPAPLHAATYSVSKDGGESVWYLYGRVDEPEGGTVQADLRYETGAGWVTVETVEIPKAQWVEKDGHWYFAETLPVTENEEGHWLSVWASLLDEEGEPLTAGEWVNGGGTGIG